jgi:hypothetical protein
MVKLGAALLLALGAALAAPSAHADTKTLCDLLDEHGAQWTFDNVAKADRQSPSPMTPNQFTLWANDQMTMCPQYRMQWARWEDGLPVTG